MEKVVFLFVKNEVKKIVATAIVGAIFLYFWINGPILNKIEVLNLETFETEYFIPIIVGKDGVDNAKNKSTFNTLDLEDKETFGNGLLFLKNQSSPNWGLIANAENTPALSEDLKNKIKKHAQQFSSPKQTIKVLPSTEMFFAQIEGEKSIYLESTEIVKNIRGYAGNINIGVFIDENGYLKRVEHISSRETPSYLEDIKNAGFYQQFQKTSLTKGFQKVDAVSGATITSKAIAQTISELIQKGIPEPISNYAETDPINSFEIKALLNNTWVIHISIIFLMFVFSIQKWIKKTKKTIIALSLFSLIYIGFFLNNSFTYVSFIHPFVGTSISSLIGLYALFVLLGAIWGKNTYCKYICPFGNVQRLLIQFNPLKTAQKFFIPNKWIKRIRATLTLVLIIGVLLGLRNWSSFELFPDLFGLNVLGFWFVIALLSVLTTLLYPMLWCRLLCPTGAVLDGISDVVNSSKYSVPFVKKK